jgi:hypothetical protein
MSPQPCKECGARPKLAGRHRCIVCHLRHEPIGEQVAASRRRLAMVPDELRRARVPEKAWPAGSRWCAGCQSFVELVDVPKGASRCRACNSAAQHGAMIAKTYGLTSGEYDELLAAQGGKCAICRGRPRSKRLAVDHNHDTGAVRGLLCSRCNHDLLGASWDSGAIALALWHYLNTPPTSGSWQAPELGLTAPGDAVRPVEPLAPVVDDFATVDLKGRPASKAEPLPPLSGRLLPDEWYAAPAATLQARYGALGALLMRVDPPPF